MKVKSILLLAVAGGCGLIAMLGVQQALSGNQGEESQVAQVLVAITDIPPGHPLDESNTAFKTWPADTIPEGSVTTVEEFEERSLRFGAVANEPIMLAKLNEKGVIGASSEIPEGMRVVTVSVDLTKTHSGLIRPGDHVDLMLTYKIRGENSSQKNVQKTKLFLENIEVFAADSIRRSGVANDTTEINSKNISLLVTPEQANILMLAESKGTLTLSLRRSGDETIAKTRDINDEDFEDLLASRGKTQEKEKVDDSLKDLLAEQQAEPKPEAKPEVKPVVNIVPEGPKWAVHIHSGSDVNTHMFYQRVESDADTTATETGTGTEAGTPGTSPFGNDLGHMGQSEWTEYHPSTDKKSSNKG